LGLGLGVELARPRRAGDEAHERALARRRPAFEHRPEHVAQRRALAQPLVLDHPEGGAQREVGCLVGGGAAHHLAQLVRLVRVGVRARVRVGVRAGVRVWGGGGGEG
jgi:hypothetical protein